MHLVEGTKQNMKGCYLNFKKKDNMIFFPHISVFIFSLNIWNELYCNGSKYLELHILYMGSSHYKQTISYYKREKNAYVFSKRMLANSKA